MTTPTKEELGLPWHLEQDVNLIPSVCDTDDCTITGDYHKVNFAIHAANTYHERDALLRECLEWLPEAAQGYMKDRDKVKLSHLCNRIEAALTPPSATPSAAQR